MSPRMFALRAQLIPPTVIALATVVSLGPHLLILAYHLAGAVPPADVLLFCPLLHHAAAVNHPSTWTLNAPPLT
jgi:hypothetical protein